MSKKFTCLLICLLWLSACSREAETPAAVNGEGQKNSLTLDKKEDIPASFFPDPVQIVSIGDSLTEGVGDSTDKGGYVPYLQRQLEKEPSITAVNIINHGVRGSRTDQLLKRMEQTETKRDIRKADSVVITIGGNDIMKVVRNHFSDLQMEQFEQARKGYEKRLGKIINKVKEENQQAQIYLVGVYNPFSDYLTSFKELDVISEDWNDSSRKVLRKFPGSHFVEIEDIFSKQGEKLLFKDDNFHPNDRGYEKIASRIYQNMEGNSLGDNTLEASAKGNEE
ncbi:Lysophospholipase L1 [Bacillus sp. OV322]|uniref:SGNH/GDSL hydrolase family protein n=1 Tax=Bacillus sp. OV322 TaxID=1882764 RepID=UPI0008F2A85F|nr:SGNH/GDSL hydrolase family protein [Bacillus sp. OV322]SFC76395.1 Lysophospholipase L1 [Bacillus sp. OV322]